MASVAKCPACGSLRESFAAICPECGYEFTDIQTSDSLQKFTDKIDEYDRTLAIQNSADEKKGVGFWTVVLWIFLFPIMFGIFIFKKISAKHESLEGIEKLKSEAILNHPIPNSRNDLLEFSILVNNRIRPLSPFNALSKSGMNIQKWNRVWVEKGSHIEKKAQIALKDDSSSLNQIAKSLQKANEQMVKNERMQWIMMGALCVIFIVFIVLAS